MSLPDSGWAASSASRLPILPAFFADRIAPSATTATPAESYPRSSSRRSPAAPIPSPGRAPIRTPFVIGIAGSVAVGKSTTARLLRELLATLPIGDRHPGADRPEHPRVELITTDGFLFPNAELERRGLMHRKGFPESYD